MSEAILRHAPLDLWRIAQTFLDVLYNLFGNPEDVAERHTLTKKPYKLLLDWLRAGEALMRRLLLIEAASYPKPNTRPLLRPQRKRTRKLRYFEAEKPAEWRVSFRCLSEDRRLPAGKNLQPARLSQVETPCRLEAGGPRRFFSAWPLAERYEALLRVFNNPAAYAQRLARRLFATPHRARELSKHPTNTPGFVGHEAFAQTDAPCAQASRHFEPG